MEWKFVIASPSLDNYLFQNAKRERKNIPSAKHYALVKGPDPWTFYQARIGPGLVKGHKEDDGNLRQILQCRAEDIKGSCCMMVSTFLMK